MSTSQNTSSLFIFSIYFSNCKFHIIYVYLLKCKILITLCLLFKVQDASRSYNEIFDHRKTPIQHSCELVTEINTPWLWPWPWLLTECLLRISHCIVSYVFPMLCLLRILQYNVCSVSLDIMYFTYSSRECLLRILQYNVYSVSLDIMYFTYSSRECLLRIPRIECLLRIPQYHVYDVFLIIINSPCASTKCLLRIPHYNKCASTKCLLQIPQIWRHTSFRAITKRRPWPCARFSRRIQQLLVYRSNLLFYFQTPFSIFALGKHSAQDWRAVPASWARTPEYVWMYVCMYVCTYVVHHVYMYVWMYVCSLYWRAVAAYPWVCMYVCIPCVYARMYACKYAFCIGVPSPRAKRVPLNIYYVCMYA
jgi:hypothetical protein